MWVYKKLKRFTLKFFFLEAVNVFINIHIAMLQMLRILEYI